MRPTLKRALCSALAFAGCLPAARAQVVDPSILQRNPAANPDRINQEQRERLQQRAAPEPAAPAQPEVIAPPPAEASADGGEEVSFALTSVTFDESAYLSRADLDALARPLIGREVTLRDLRGLVDAVNALYARRGLTTARAALPPQTIDAGTVHIRLIEGRIGDVTVEGASGRGAEQVLKNAAPEKGSLAAPEDIAARLRYFNINNDAQLRARLAPGGAFGATDLVITAAEPSRSSADLFMDNNGFSSTGAFEAGVILRGHRLLTGDDRLSAVVMGSRGVRSGSVSYGAPVGARTRAGLSMSYGTTHIIYGDLAPLNVRGDSLSFGGDLTTILHAGDRMTLLGTVAAQAGRSNTRIAGETVIRNLSGSVTAGMTMTYAAPGFSLTAQHNFALAMVEERLSGDTTRALLIQGSVLASKALGERVQFRARGDWQASTRRNLPGILQYQIGGSRSSRAFAPGVAAGDKGYSASLELGYGVPLRSGGVEPFLFVDHAQAHIPDLRSTASSAGGGLNIALGPNLTGRLSMAKRIGHSGTATGTHRFLFSINARLGTGE